MHLRLFEGDIETSSLLPAYNHNAIVNGYFRLLGKIIVHSVMQEGPAFPCLPEAIYHYIITENIDDAMVHMSLENLPVHAAVLVEQVSTLIYSL